MGPTGLDGFCSSYQAKGWCLLLESEPKESSMIRDDVCLFRNPSMMLPLCQQKNQPSCQSGAENFADPVAQNVATQASEGAQKGTREHGMNIPHGFGGLAGYIYKYIYIYIYIYIYCLHSRIIFCCILPRDVRTESLFAN